ncbi:MAG: hypothetical protein JOZ83_16035 [Silvibacterium sp.]|nr:hypothetical protein [Silvibacterium sp.]
MTSNRIFVAATLLSLLAAVSPALAQGGDTATVQTVVTAVAKSKENPAPLRRQDIEVQVGGRSAQITDLVPLQGEKAGLELVILIDGSARSSIGTQLRDIELFVKSLPPTTAVGIAYMENGRAAFSQPLTADKIAALKALRLPAGSPGSTGSPYFCLSDLAKHWPSNNRENRREVVMITDGVDPYNLRFDPDNPYVQAAIDDSVRAGIIVNSIYWQNRGRYDANFYQNNAGESLLDQVAQVTGGKAYWQGVGDPVSFAPFFDDLSHRLQNQYELGFEAPAKSKPGIENLKVRLNEPEVRIEAPQRVMVAPQAVARQ